MRLLTLSLALALATTSFLLSQQQAAANEDAAAKAQALLAQARAALGGEAKWQTLQSLTITGNMRRLMGGREMAGQIQFDLLLPDKIMRTETTSMMGMELTYVQALNGETVWNDQQNSGGGGGGMVMIRRGNSDTPQGREAAQRNIRAELTRFMLGCLLKAPASAGLQFSFAGEAEAPDGKAAVIEVKGAQGFAARLFLDQKSQRPLMLTYLERKPIVMTHTGGAIPTPEELKKRAEEAEAQAAAQPPVEYQMRFDDFREEGGLVFPHKIIRSIADEVSEEWELNKFKLNPQLKPEKFVQKKS